MTLFSANNDCILGILNLIQNQIFSMMKSFNHKEKDMVELLKTIQDFQYNDELSEKYKREILDKDKIYD
ncbi:Hypothetical protein P9215_16721 [Prochlorococcus marinus str. MIT 9215]|uniref:Uncharacterized protein n=1 Tax=Prochlorococcus marinus (strain MIT 9215) TaxID=93060 RepID=A8G6Q4_PROM2|nr:hypothetical protein [Prochlorococcus marinus]ABV51285.1 Hypothetical protein P9215_16721 [Prochlorococcus marinus str. MIT 9215]